MAIRVYDTVSGSTFIFPMLPENIGFSAETTFFEYELMKTGRVAIPSGEELSEISFKGILPGEGKRNFPFVSNWRSPKSIQETWSVWRTQGRKLRITIDGTPINHGVYLRSYDIEYSGGQGDYSYNISFIMAKVVEIKVESNPGNKNPDDNENKRTVKVTAKTKVRKKANTSAKVVFTAKKGEEYEYADKKSGNWYRIYSEDKEKCWISTRHSKLT